MGDSHGTRTKPALGKASRVNDCGQLLCWNARGAAECADVGVDTYDLQRLSLTELIGFESTPTGHREAAWHASVWRLLDA
jgi:hypothetical protein